MPNIELMRLALKEIEREPETWNQANWHCGTTCCFAGKVAQLSGATWAGGRETEVVHTPDDRYMRVADYAMEVLDIDWADMWALFYGPTDLARLTRHVDFIEARS